jgi:hypothetical protein
MKIFLVEIFGCLLKMLYLCAIIRCGMWVRGRDNVPLFVFISIDFQ